MSTPADTDFLEPVERVTRRAYRHERRHHAAEPLDERYGLVGVRDLAEYPEALTRLLDHGRRERCVALLSEAAASDSAITPSPSVSTGAIRYPLP
jgi:hypothetical protein